VKVVLPVIAETVADRQARPRLPVIFDIGAHLFLEECESPLPAAA
jgi:hypothetical protein